MDNRIISPPPQLSNMERQTHKRPRLISLLVGNSVEYQYGTILKHNKSMNNIGNDSTKIFQILLKLNIYRWEKETSDSI